MLAGDGAIVVTAGARNPQWPASVEMLVLPDANGRVDLAQAMRELAARGMNELHVEAGARFVGALVDAGLVDEWLLYLAPSLIGDPARGIVGRRAPLTDLASRLQMAIASVDRIGDDLRIVARARESG